MQIFLKDQGVEIYPEELITGYYGKLTVKAVQRFQCKYGIVCSGTPETTGYGLAGPITRVKINEILSSGQIATAPITTLTIDKQALIEQIKAQIVFLQEKLIQLLNQLIELSQERIKAIQ